MFALTNIEDLGSRFAPCAVDRLLLKTRSAMVKRAMMAQKVLLSSQWLETGPVMKNLHRGGFKHNFDEEHKVFKTPWSYIRGKTSGRETQQPNLTKGRTLRQIHE